MANKSPPAEAGFPQAQRDTGVAFLVTLLLSLVAVMGSFTWPYILSPSGLSNEDGAAVEMVTLLALLLGSLVALILALVAGRRLRRGYWRCSWKSVALTASAALTALPGLFGGLFLVSAFIYSQMPLTASELRGIQIAERFVERNGYTPAGHPKDLPVVQNDIMDRLAGSTEKLLEMRKGTLQAKAAGVKSFGSHMWVFFDSTPPGAYGPNRAVEVADDGAARMVHPDIIARWYKKNER